VPATGPASVTSGPGRLRLDGIGSRRGYGLGQRVNRRFLVTHERTSRAKRVPSLPLEQSRTSGTPPCHYGNPGTVRVNLGTEG